MLKKQDPRIEKLAKAYQKALGGSLKEACKLVLVEIEEDCIESVEQNVADGLLCIGRQDIGKLLR